MPVKRRLLPVAVSIGCLAAGFALAQPQGEKAARDFVPLAFKRPGGYEVSIQPSVTWDGPRSADTASAVLVILERGRSGSAGDREITLSLRPDQLKMLHTRLGDMLTAIEAAADAPPAGGGQ